MKFIALLTDFGSADGYVAAMRSVILGLCPDARFIDISHEVRPQAIDQGAYLIGTVAPYLPAGTVILGVVDPGVGTDRPAIAAEWPGGRFVGPDNGLWHDVLAYCELKETAPPRRLVEGLPAGCRAVRLANPAYWRPEVSATFHGRDIFAPVAAHLARGVALAEFGPPVETICRLPAGWQQRPDGALLGRVRHIDRFGNLITSLPVRAIDGSRWSLRLGDLTIPHLHRTYAEGRSGEPTALVGSSGYLEIVVPNGSAAETLGVPLGAAVIATRGEG